VAVMAHLRAALTTPPGYDYTILSYTRVPDTFLSTEYRDAATKEEQAKHLALALYAVHQQSIYDQPMHRDGVGLGTAISQLSRAAASEEAVRRRFAALGTAISFDEASYHLRSLIRLLRDKRIAIDYGLLADDLLALQSADGRARVRALWGREYYRAPDETSTSEESADVIDEASRIPDKEGPCLTRPLTSTFCRRCRPATSTATTRALRRRPSTVERAVPGCPASPGSVRSGWLSGRPSMTRSSANAP